MKIESLLTSEREGPRRPAPGAQTAENKMFVFFKSHKIIRQMNNSMTFYLYSSAQHCDQYASLRCLLQTTFL